MYMVLVSSDRTVTGDTAFSYMVATAIARCDTSLYKKVLPAGVEKSGERGFPPAFLISFLLYPARTPHMSAKIIYLYLR
jgi:hypothetical protein